MGNVSAATGFWTCLVSLILCGTLSAAAVPTAPTVPTVVLPPAPLVQPRKADGDGSVKVEGELKQWHKVTVTLDGPFAYERDREPNPFTDCRMTVTFRHESGSPQYVVPGYFAADGDAGNTSAESGTKWRAHLSPDKPGWWTYAISFVKGKGIALDPAAVGEQLARFDGKTGTFDVGPTDKTGRDFRAKGRLQYVGKHHLRFAGTGEYFLKAGPDSPENLLAYVDLDGTRSNKNRQARSGEAAPSSLKTWEPHVQDWKAGDPTWKDGKGKGLIGALNYIAAAGCNTFSFLSYNAGGDGDDVWPFVERDYKFNYDCSKLDQWQVLFDHGQKLGLYLHFKLQETENDDLKGPGAAQSLDGGDTGPQRKLYLRELIARFGHALALNWNLGEENTQSPAQQQAMAKYILDTDPYNHHIVIHTYPNEQDKVYTQLVGDQSVLTGASLQNGWNSTHQRTLKWIGESAKAGRPWVVANDEQGPANLGVPPDPGFAGFEGKAGAKDGKGGYDLHDTRKATLWGNLMAGGAGVEYYFGYQLPQNDLNAHDFRSRDKSWNYCRLALEFFHANRIPFWDMASANALVGNAKNDNSRYCFAKPGEVYVVYLPSGGSAELDLTGVVGAFDVSWFDPRNGGELRKSDVARIAGGGKATLGQPPADVGEDWVVLVKRAAN